MTEDDLKFADSLRALAGWNQTMADWRRLLRLGGNGCFIAHLDGIPTGVVTTTIYGPELAWIGMALVHPDFRRRGIGSALLRRAIEFLRSSGVNTIKLDATPQGKANYARAGFRAEWNLTRWEGIAPAAAASLDGVRPCRMDDLGAIQEMDATAMGLRRGALIQETLRESCVALVHEDRESRVDGFALARDGARAFYFGPIVARSADVALKLASETLRRLQGERIFWDVPDDQEIVASWVRKQGFTAQRQLTRMNLGEAIESRAKVEWTFGIAGPEWG